MLTISRPYSFISHPATKEIIVAIGAIATVAIVTDGRFIEIAKR